MDASVGLEFNLRLFQRYRRSGLLRAQVHHVPGVQGVCTAYVQLSNGVVTESYVENKLGQRIPLSVDILCNIDDQKGPFEWIFQKDTAPFSSASSAPSSSAKGSFSQPFPDSLIPGTIAPLPLEKFGHWTPKQRQMLQNVWSVIDGRRTIREIKAYLPIAPQAIDEILQILQTLQVITFVPR